MAKRGIHRRTKIDLTPDLVVRFWVKVEKQGPDDCWNWTASTRAGYGALKSKGKVLSAHCLSWVITHGPIPAGEVIRHSCDNRKCCNPAHLLSGSPKDNVHDQIKRGRFNHVRGEECYQAVLTEPLVRAIRILHQQTGDGYRVIAAKLGLQDYEHAIQDVINQRTWKHILGTPGGASGGATTSKAG